MTPYIETFLFFMIAPPFFGFLVFYCQLSFDPTFSRRQDQIVRPSGHPLLTGEESDTWYYAFMIAIHGVLLTDIKLDKTLSRSIQQENSGGPTKPAEIAYSD